MHWISEISTPPHAELLGYLAEGYELVTLHIYSKPELVIAVLGRREHNRLVTLLIAPLKLSLFSLTAIARYDAEARSKPPGRIP